ncbi:flagellar basal body P-ring protein FlgI [Pirellulales bacterium]|nr:flagellar basal body P-ring protein FlgI [Pirellulales bacterium]
MNFQKVEAVGLVTGLDGTGEDPPPSPQRASILADMNRRDIDSPNEVLASPQTAIVLLRGFLRPGIHEGDVFDIEIRTPSRSDTTSLRGAWLLETRLTETAVLGGQLRTGHVLSVAQGPVLVDPSADEDDALATRGRILGGAISTESRDLGLILDHEHQSIRLSQQTAKAINLRFHTFFDSRRRGVATPKTDEFIELKVHPRYKDNVSRFMRVVRNIAVKESPSAQITRIALLRDQLLDPVTTSTAALRLEAIGNDEAVETLLEGIKSSDPEVRFHAAEALAYLDRTEAATPLAEAARDQPAYRVSAMAALSAMDDGAAYDELLQMLKLTNARTRYGAFRALWSMSADDPTIRGEQIGGKFGYHVLDIDAPALVHATSSHRPEIVLFGRRHRLKMPLMLNAGPRVLVNGLGGNEIIVSRFSPDEPTQQRTVTNDLDAVIRAIVDLGGDYPDVVQMLQEAEEAGVLTSRFRVNALPESGLELLDRDADDDETDRPKAGVVAQE